jgi:histidinol-phosphatase (PHP family)
MQVMKEFIDTQSFDFVLGSLHHQLPAFRQWLGKSTYTSDAEIVAAYFQCLAEGAQSGIYHSLAHPDVIRIYGTLQNPFKPADYEPAILDFLDQVAESGVCLEVNTSGLLKGDFVVHPDPRIIDWAIARGIPFTMGSDSHAPQMVGQFFNPVIAELKTKGLGELHYFKKGERVTVQL